MSYVLLALAWGLTGFLGISAYVWVWSYRNSLERGFGRRKSVEIAWGVVRVSCRNRHGLKVSGWGIFAPVYLWWIWHGPAARRGPA